jgi:hypothetical protein
MGNSMLMLRFRWPNKLANSDEPREQGLPRQSTGFVGFGIRSPPLFYPCTLHDLDLDLRRQITWSQDRSRTRAKPENRDGRERLEEAKDWLDGLG